jgi:hypothetical protein
LIHSSPLAVSLSLSLSGNNFLILLLFLHPPKGYLLLPLASIVLL